MEVQTHRCPDHKNVHEQLGRGINYREIGGKFGVSGSTACEKINKAGTDENLFTLVPVPEHGAQISAWAPTKGYVQTAAVPGGNGYGNQA